MDEEFDEFGIPVTKAASASAEGKFDEYGIPITPSKVGKTQPPSSPAVGGGSKLVGGAGMKNITLPSVGEGGAFDFYDIPNVKVDEPMDAYNVGGLLNTFKRANKLKTLPNEAGLRKKLEGKTFREAAEMLGRPIPKEGKPAAKKEVVETEFRLPTEAELATIEKKPLTKDEMLEQAVRLSTPPVERVTKDIKNNKAQILSAEKELQETEAELNTYKQQSELLLDVINNETLSLSAAGRNEKNKAIDEYNKLIDDVAPLNEKYNTLANNYNGYINNQKTLFSDLDKAEKMRQKGLEKEYSHLLNLTQSVGRDLIKTVSGMVGIGSTANSIIPNFGLITPEQEKDARAELKGGLKQLNEFADKLITQETPENYKKMFEGDFSLGKLAYITTNAISSTAPTVAAGLLTGGLGAVAAGAGLGFEESKNIMKDAGLSDEQSDWAALALAIPIGLLEKYGADDVVRLLNGSAIRKEVATELAKKIAGKSLTKDAIFLEAKKTFGEAIKSKTTKLLKEGRNESLTEMAQGELQENVKQIVQEFTGVDGDENMPTEDYVKKRLLQRAEEGAGGFLGGTSMQGAGTVFNAALNKKEFSPSAYTKAMEFSDPAKFEQFKNDLLQEVQSGVLTEEQANDAISNVQAIQETNALIPKSVQNLDLRTEAVNLIIEKNDLAKEVEGKDPDLIIAENTRLAEIKKSLNEIALGKSPAAAQNATAAAEAAATTAATTAEATAEPTPTTAETITAEPIPSVTFESAIAVPENDFVYNGEKGKLVQEGQTVSFETDNRIYELGSVDELSSKGIDELGIEQLSAIDVVLNDDNSLVIEGEKFVNNFSNPDAAINYDSDGNVQSVNLETENGQKRTFRGQRAEEIAYQYKLKSLEQNGTDEQIDTAIEQAEQAVEAERVADETAPKRKGKSARQRRKEKRLTKPKQDEKAEERPMLEGLQAVGDETKGGQASPELRTEIEAKGEEVTPALRDVESTAKDIESKRIATEAKIKRKDLFDGVGDFSSQLGGSNKAAVPISHKEKNGIEFVEYAHPETGSVDVIVTGKSDNDFVGFYRIYENGKPTNKWSSKFENQSRNKEDFKTMISGVQEMLPQGHEYTEKTSISTDGLRVWEQQLSRGYELQYDENGKLKTNLVAINGDAIVNELGIPVEKGEFENIKVKSEKEFEIVKKALLPYLEKLGLNESDVRWLTGTVKINLPVLQSSAQPSAEVAQPSATQQPTKTKQDESTKQGGTTTPPTSERVTGGQGKTTGQSQKQPAAETQNAEAANRQAGVPSQENELAPTAPTSQSVSIFQELDKVPSQSKGKRAKAERAKFDKKHGEKAKQAKDINANFEAYEKKLMDEGVITKKEC
jgi:hypothetical protein